MIWGAGRGGGGGGAGRGGGSAGLAISGAGCGGGGGGGATRRGTALSIVGLDGAGGMGLDTDKPGLGGSGGAPPRFCSDSGMSGFVSWICAAPPALGAPMLAPGVAVPSVFGPPVAPGICGAAAAGGVVPGASRRLGFVAFGSRAAPPGGTGGAPFVPGIGSALAFGNVSGARFEGNGLFGIALRPAGAPGVPGFTTGLIAALGGTGSFPCWISEALCATEGGRAGPDAAGVVPPGPGVPCAAPGGGAPIPGATGPG